MTTYIDANEAICKIMSNGVQNPSYCIQMTPAEQEDYVIGVIKSCKTFDVSPIVHGRWIVTEFYGAHHMMIVQCSACKKESEGSLNDAFCPHCGAKMDMR